MEGGGFASIMRYHIIHALYWFKFRFDDVFQFAKFMNRCIRIFGRGFFLGSVDEYGFEVDLMGG